MATSERFSLERAAQYAGLSPQTLKQQAENGRLDAEKVDGEWATTMSSLIKYLSGRRKNAGDVPIICLDCERVYLNPSQAAIVVVISGLRILGCPRCGSTRMGIAATDVDVGHRSGHALETGLKRAAERAQHQGSAVEEFTDATGAAVRIMATAGDGLSVSIELDRDGELDPRDGARVKGIVAAAFGPGVAALGPHIVARYDVQLERGRQRTVEGSRDLSDIRTGKPGTKYIRFTVDAWYQADDDSIHLTSPDDGRFHSTVNDKPGSKRQHSSLYRHLRRLLEGADRWPDSTSSGRVSRAGAVPTFEGGPNR